MTPDLLSSSWSLPSGRLFIQKLGQDLQEGISYLIILPTEADIVEFKTNLIHALRSEYFLTCELIDLSESDDRDPFRFLKSMYPDLEPCQYLEQAIGMSCLPNALIIENVEQISNDLQQSWMNVIKRWSDVCRSQDYKNTLVFILPAAIVEKIALPPNDVRLRYRVWNGIPSSLEMRLLCRMKSTDNDLHSQWREHMLASLGGSDLQMYEALWEVVEQDEQKVFAAIREYAETRGWGDGKAPKQLTSWKPSPPGRFPELKPGQAAFLLHCQGLIVFSEEYGEELHSAALMTLGRTEDLRHRVWRAQVAFLLPMVDEIRRRICDYMTIKHGKKWAVLDDTCLESPIEWGELMTFFSRLPDTSWEKQQWDRGIQLSWWIRNELAHYKSIPFKKYTDFWYFSRSVHQMLLR